MWAGGILGASKFLREILKSGFEIGIFAWKPKKSDMPLEFPHEKCHFLLNMYFLLKEIKNLTSNFT
jgi:hypothetical protein